MQENIVKNRNKVLGIFYLFLTAIIWGGAFIAQFLGGTIVGSFSFIFYRNIIGVITIFIITVLVNVKNTKQVTFWTKGENKKKTILNSFWCGLFLFFSMYLQQIGVEMTDTAKSGFISSLEVVLVPILLSISGNKKIKPKVWFFVMLSFIGITLLSINSLNGINMGDILVFASAILYSITIIQVPVYTYDISPLKFSLFRFVLIVLISFVGAIIFERNSVFDLNGLKLALPSIIFTGAMSSGIAYTTQILGQQYCEPVVATLILGLEGVFAAIFGYIFLGQILTPIQILGCAICLVGNFLIQILED